MTDDSITAADLDRLRDHLEDVAEGLTEETEQFRRANAAYAAAYDRAPLRQRLKHELPHTRAN